MIISSHIINNVYWVQCGKHLSTTCFTDEETEVQIILPPSQSLGFEAPHNGVSVLDRRTSLSLWKPEKVIRLAPETLKLANPSNSSNSDPVLRFLALETEVDPLG